ncbi:MAG: hypothetical protein ACTMIR_03400 [Cellulomonadaceae bacterium]
MSALSPSRPARLARPRRPQEGPRRRIVETLSDALVVGVAVFVSIPTLVGVVPTIAVGVRYLRAAHEGLAVSLRELLADWRHAFGDLWALGVATVLLAAVLLVDLLAVGHGELRTPGMLSAALVTIALCVVLRATGEWSGLDGRAPRARRPASTLVRSAWTATRHDLSGTALLLAALTMSGVLVWMLLPMAVIVGGMLALAVQAVAARKARASHTVADDGASPSPEGG